MTTFSKWHQPINTIEQCEVNSGVGAKPHPCKRVFHKEEFNFPHKHFRGCCCSLSTKGCLLFVHPDFLGNLLLSFLANCACHLSLGLFQKLIFFCYCVIFWGPVKLGLRSIGCLSLRDFRLRCLALFVWYSAIWLPIYLSTHFSFTYLHYRWTKLNLLNFLSSPLCGFVSFPFPWKLTLQCLLVLQCFLSFEPQLKVIPLWERCFASSHLEMAYAFSGLPALLGWFCLTILIDFLPGLHLLVFNVSLSVCSRRNVSLLSH